MDSDQDEDRVGLCARCRHAQIIRSDRGSMFYRCRKSDSDPRFPKYPRLPVQSCTGFERLAASAEPLTASDPKQ